MIQVTISKESFFIKGFKVSGHAGYSENEDDIVCAAVSILAYTALNSLKEVAEISEQDIRFNVDEDEGLLEVNTNKINDKSEVIYKNFIVGINLLLEEYSKYITLRYEEV